MSCARRFLRWRAAPERFFFCWPAGRGLLSERGEYKKCGNERRYEPLAGLERARSIRRGGCDGRPGRAGKSQHIRCSLNTYVTSGGGATDDEGGSGGGAADELEGAGGGGGGGGGAGEDDAADGGEAEDGATGGGVLLSAGAGDGGGVLLSAGAGDDEGGGELF